MPPRLNKRQLREQEELYALQDTADDVQSDSDVGAPVLQAPLKSSAGGFAALLESQEMHDDSEEEGATQAHSSKSKKKKKKKTTTASVAHNPSPSTQTPPAIIETVSTGASTPAGPSKKDKKTSKKQRAKEKDDGDDLDKALAELSVKYPELKQQLASSIPISSAATARSLAGLLSVSLSHLDSEAELRKFFGAKVISSVKGSSSSSSSRQSVAQRSNLTRPQSSWAPARFREGLSVRTLTPEEAEHGLRRHLRQPLHGEKVWTVEYSKKYRAMTFDFMRTVLSGDPEGFWIILRELPYHADTLLQLSEVSHHREEHSTASDLVDRALFAYERAFVGAFNFTNGGDRLEFDRVENRPFFLALHRQITDLQRRGCVRTSFEYARLLYALDPWTDPHGSLLHLDFLAIRTGMTRWLLDLWDVFESEAESEPSDPKTPYFRRIIPIILPGMAYSRALALFIHEEDSHDDVHEQSAHALEHAVRTFPSVVPLLADKADIALGGDVRGHPAFRIQTDNSRLVTDSQIILHLLSHLYAQRTSSFWKSPIRAAWFTKAVTNVLPSLPLFSPPPPGSFSARFDCPSLARSIYRHVLVNESTCRSLFSFVPRSVLDSRHLACDPLPPPTRVSEYDAEFFRGVEESRSASGPRSRRQEARLLERLVPDGAFRAQLVGFWEAHPAVQERFPGGVAQFAQLAVQMPEEALEDLLIALAEQIPQDRAGAMPGGMPGGEEEGGVMVNFAGPDDDVEDLDGVPERGGGRVGGRPAGVERGDRGDDDDDDGDDDEEDEEEEVAVLPVRILRNVINRFWGGGARRVEEEDSSDENDGRRQLRDNEGVD